MKTISFKVNRPFIAVYFFSVTLTILLLGACKKTHENDHSNNGAPAASYSSEVLDKWMTLQLQLMRNATGIPNHGFARHFAYTGIAALESITPGLPAGAKWSAVWNGLTGLPTIAYKQEYYYPASVNAAMATINKAMFPNASAADRATIDSLEAALNSEFFTTQKQSVMDASVQYGKAVATAVFNWAETDGYKVANAPYTAPSGPGLWKPTAPAFAAPATPYWGNNRLIISGSTANTQSETPPPYSTDPASPFFAMVKQVYDVSQNLTDDQKAMAIFWRDVPGATSPGHMLCILRQLVRQTKPALDKTALAYALTGTAGNDALICCFKSKYQYNLVRPITYIREVMGHTSWNSYIGTPAHPEYSSAHSALSGASIAVLEKLFGNVGSFTDHTYDYLGLASRTYATLKAIGEEAGQSRLYAGIHCQPSINAGLAQGRKVVANIFAIKLP